MNNYPRTEILQQVFLISSDQKTVGTCFAYCHNNKCYLLTVAHNVKNIAHEHSSILYIYKDKWEAIKIIPIFVDGKSFKDGDTDLVIIKAELSVTHNSMFKLSGSVTLGEDVYFLGFPYYNSLIKYKSEAINNGFPLPFIKKGVVSAINNKLIFLDGHNNPGFSGGPIAYYDVKEQKTIIIGIITGYLNHYGEIYDLVNDGNSKKGLFKKSDTFYKENSGIAVGYGIKPILELLQKL